MALYYFGYGSNLSSQVMWDWCPQHQRLGAAELRDWHLAFRRLSQRWGAGVADIIPHPGSIVWGGLYQVSEADVSALDRKESNGQNYQRITVEVHQEEQSFTAFTYTVIDKLPQDIPTSIAYRDTMLVGARELGLPIAYIERIAALPIFES